MLRNLGLLVLAAAILAGCGGKRRAAQYTEPAYERVERYSPVGVRYADLDPVEWQGTAPWRYPIHGLDVSKFQETIDWNTARRSGIRFAFIKATEGGDHTDSHFLKNWYGAERAGIPRGAYHFYYFCRPAYQQAQWFIQNVPRSAGALPPVLDMEWNHQSRTCRYKPDARTIQSEMRIFLNMLERHYGKRPIIYTSPDFYQDAQLASFRGYEFWLRSVADHPANVYRRNDWSFWQYTGTGVVPGVPTKTDINVFAGSEQSWQNWLQAKLR